MNLRACLFSLVTLSAACVHEAPAPGTVLEGVILRQPWQKSVDSWQAGGSDYFILQLEAETPGTPDSVVLQPSEHMSADAFAPWEGQHVRCRGVFVEGTPYKPPTDAIVQMPAPMRNPLSGELEMPTVGAGFSVFAIDHAD